MTYIFDIDNTLADGSNRVKYIVPPKGTKTIITEDGAKLDWDGPDWDKFYEHCGEDKIILNVWNIAKMLYDNDNNFIFITGRPEKYRTITESWLKRHGFDNGFELYMRQNGDHRQDYIVKEELFKHNIGGKYRVSAVFEDRSTCVKMWRKLGLTCLQVADGDY